MKKWERSRRAKKTAAAAGSASIQSFFKPKSAKGGPIASSQEALEPASQIQSQSQREPSVRLRPPRDDVAVGTSQQPKQAAPASPLNARLASRIISRNRVADFLW